MIWNTAALAIVLATANAGIQPTQLLQKSHIKEVHSRNVARLTKKVDAAPRTLLNGPVNERFLLDNEAFLNYAYSSDAACDQKPYSFSGIGMASCIPDNGGGSHMYACEGPQASINISYWNWASDDCSGNPSSVGFLIQDGTCGAAGDDDFIDDRLSEADDFTYDAGSYSFSCDATRSATNSYQDLSAYNDNSCNILTGYTGLNKGSCIPVLGPGIYAKSNDECELTIYSDDTCTTKTGNGDDDGDDDGNVDDYDDDYDDDGIPSGTCFAFPPNGDDDFVYPGQYFFIQKGSCKADDGDDDTCFAGSETVLLESGITKAISDVNIGDMVQVVTADGSLSFSEVVFLPHGANTQKATFTELEMASGNSLRATPAHFVLAGACGADAFELTAMKDVSEGDCVQTASGEDAVTGSGLVVDYGIYTIVTKESSGLVVVNGVRASSFAHNHWLVNNYYNIHRAVYSVAPFLMKNRDVIAANLIVGDIAMSL